MAELKTKKNKASVSAFLNSIKDEQRRKDAKAVLKVFKEATGQKPVMWGTSIVGFGEYHYKSERSRQEGDWPLTGFSPRQQALTLYIMPGVKKYPELLKKVGPHKTGSSCLYIKKLEEMDLTVLKQIIKKSVADMKKIYKVK